LRMMVVAPPRTDPEPMTGACNRPKTLQSCMRKTLFKARSMVPGRMVALLRELHRWCQERRIVWGPRGHRFQDSAGRKDARLRRHAFIRVAGDCSPRDGPDGHHGRNGSSRGMPIATSARQKSLRKLTESLQRGRLLPCAKSNKRPFSTARHCALNFCSTRSRASEPFRSDGAS
jgi:hypothetical protein